MKPLKIMFFLIVIFPALAYPPDSFKNPRETMLYFLKTMKGYKTGDRGALDLATKALDLSQIDEASRKESGELAAIKLINTLDRIELIDIKKVPSSSKGKKWVYKTKSIGDKNAVIAIEKIDNDRWKFSAQTIRTIAIYEDFIKNKPVVKGVIQLTTFTEKLKAQMPDWTGNSPFLLKNGQWVGLFLLIFLAFFLEKMARYLVGRFASRLLLASNIQIDLTQQKKFTFPIGLITFSLAWILGIRILELGPSTLAVLLRAGYVLSSIGVVLASYHFVDYLCLFLEKKAAESENKFDDILVPLVRKTAKFFVITVGVIFIGDSLTLDMKSLIAGLGIGGLAFALAAKDTLSNLFGSLTVLLDRPFRIGDWVVINKEIEGIVEEVGMRSCRIRTFYDSLVTLPNGQLTNAHIDNYGQRKFRRFSTKIGIQYDTPPELIEAFCEGVREVIRKHPLTRKDYFHVYLNGMGASSLDILLYVFWPAKDWTEELQQKHKLLIDILKIGHQMGVEFAFPTQTLHVQQQGETQYAPIDGKIEDFGRSSAQEILKQH